MPFAAPMVWREQSEHVTGCYFCMTKIREDFLDKISPKFPKPCACQPLNQFPTTQICLYLSLQLKRKMPCLLMNVGTGTESEKDLIESDPSFQHESAPLLINQERLNDLVRDLYLSTEKVEV